MAGGLPRVAQAGPESPEYLPIASCWSRAVAWLLGDHQEAEKGGSEMVKQTEAQQAVARRTRKAAAPKEVVKSREELRQ